METIESETEENEKINKAVRNRTTSLGLIFVKLESPKRGGTDKNNNNEEIMTKIC